MTYLRPAIRSLEEVPHGGLNLSEVLALGVDPASIIDLSVNTNPLGPSPTVLAAAGKADAAHYPSTTAAPFRQAVADAFDVSIEQVIAGNGAAELIWMLAMATIEAGRSAAILGPTFGEYAHAVQVMGGRIHEIRAKAPHFVPPVQEFRKLLVERPPSIAFVCHPNNPTGQPLDRESVRSLLSFAPNTLLVVDEAYLPFSHAESMLPLLADFANLVIIRSMTKDAAIPGLRLGYALAGHTVASALRAVAPPWNVNSAAAAAGIASLADPTWAERGAEVTRQQMTTLTTGLRAKGYAPVPTSTNFLIVPVPNAPETRQNLMRAGLLVRDCTSFGLPNYLRIAAGPPPAIERLLSVLPPV